MNEFLLENFEILLTKNSKTFKNLKAIKCQSDN